MLISNYKISSSSFSTLSNFIFTEHTMTQCITQSTCICTGQIHIDYVIHSVSLSHSLYVFAQSKYMQTTRQQTQTRGSGKYIQTMRQQTQTMQWQTVTDAMADAMADSDKCTYRLLLSHLLNLMANHVREKQNKNKYHVRQSDNLLADS